MARPGRKRKDRLREQPSRPRRDEGTPELQARRRWYAQQGDPALSTYPLGILLANEQITEEQHRAGCYYAWLHKVCYGRESLAAARYDDVPRGADDSADDKWLQQQRRRLQCLLEVVNAQPSTVRSALDSLAVYERVPRWMKPVAPRVSDVREAQGVLRALADLESCCAGVLKKVA